MQNFNTDEEKQKHLKNKKKLRIIGFILAITGGICAAVGIIDFFIHFNLESGMPKLTFMSFIGIPLLAIGTTLVIISYMGEVHKFVSKEIKPGVQHLASGIAEVVEDSVDVIKKQGIRCPHCQALNSINAKYCNTCGKPLTKTCQYCGKESSADSKFCDNCGQKM